MDVCEICVHHSIDEDGDIYCDVNCCEVDKFIASPIYRAAPAMHEALKATVDFLMETGFADEAELPFLSQIKDALVLAEGKD